MEKFYTINEVSKMSGFTTRSLRNFIQDGFLQGEKIDGVWKFSVNQFEKFIKNPNIWAGVVSKNNCAVFDFLADSNKAENEICMILDLKASTMEEMKEISDFFCGKSNEAENVNFQMKMQKLGENVRIILRGSETFVSDVIKEWYK